MHHGETRTELSYPSSLPVPTLSLVMPCYNECDQIEKVIAEWAQCMEEHGISFELIVINDGSLDGTGRVLDRLRRELRYLRVVHQLNSGHGKAVRRGYELARGQWILQIDSNGCFDPSDFQLMWEKREGSVLLVGERSHRLDSLLKRGLVRLVSRFIRSTYKVSVVDPDVSFRLFQREPVMKLLRFIPKTSDSVNLAMTVVLKKENPGSVVDIRIPYRVRPTVRGRLKIRHLVHNLFHTLSELTQLKVALKLQSI